MRPVKMSIVFATLTYAIIKPNLARQLVLAMLFGVIGVLIWAWIDEQVLVGVIVDVLVNDSLEGSALITTQPLFSPAEVVRIPSAIVNGHGFNFHDIVIVFGEQSNFLNEDLKEEQILFANQVGTLPWTILIERIDEFARNADLARIHPGGAIVISGLIVLFAHWIVRAGGAVIFSAAGATALLFAAHFNEQFGIIPLPKVGDTAIVSTGALVGAALAFKALRSARWSAGVRGAGFVTALAMMPLVSALHLVPDVLLWVLPVTGIIFPVTGPLLLASVILIVGFELAPDQSALALIAVIMLRWVWGHIKASKAPNSDQPKNFPLNPDRRGQFPIDDLLTK